MTEGELRDLIERDVAVQEMTQHRGWALLEDYMRAQLEAEQRSLLLGNAKDMEHYRQRTGWLKGVTEVLTAPETLHDQVERARKEYDLAQQSG